MGDNVVLPREVVVALAHETTVDLVVCLGGRSALGGLELERLAFARAEVGLKHYLVRGFVAVRVDQLGEHRLAPRIHDLGLLQIPAGHHFDEISERDRNRLGLAFRGQGIGENYNDRIWFARDRGHGRRCCRLGRSGLGLGCSGVGLGRGSRRGLTRGWSSERGHGRE